MNSTDFLDLLGVDWTRRWKVVRGVVVVALLVLVPTETVVQGVDWYAHQKADQIVEQLAPAIPSGPDKP